MSRLLLFVYLFLSCYLTGCAYLNSFRSDLPQQIDEWVKQKEYHQALSILSHIDPTNKNYSLLIAKKKEIIKLIGVFEKRKISRAQKLARENQWDRASTVYTDALKKLPTSKPISNAYATFVIKRDEHVKELQSDLLPSMAERLIHDIQIQIKITKVIPSDIKAHLLLKKLKNDAKTTSASLISLSDDALKNKNYTQAKRYILLSHKLSPTSGTKQRLTRINKKIGKLDKNIAHQAKIAYEELLSKYKHAFKQGNLLQAHQIIMELRRHNKNDPQTKELYEQLDAKIKSTVRSGIIEGRKLYTQGEIKQALDKWNQLRPLDPDNSELLASINRAERVLNKLRSLKDSNTSISMPNQN